VAAIASSVPLFVITLAYSLWQEPWRGSRTRGRYAIHLLRAPPGITDNRPCASSRNLRSTWREPRAHGFYTSICPYTPV